MHPHFLASWHGTTREPQVVRSNIPSKSFQQSDLALSKIRSGGIQGGLRCLLIVAFRNGGRPPDLPSFVPNRDAAHRYEETPPSDNKARAQGPTLQQATPEAW